MVNQWEVQRSGGICEKTGRLIEEGDEFYSVLFEDGESFRRADYCIDAWDGKPEGAFCFFKSRKPAKDKKKKTLVDDQMLRAFFLRLEGESELSRIHFRFVLALILMRKRVLRYEGSEVDGEAETWTMRFSGDEKRHRVLNPKLAEEQIEEVSKQLSAIMHSDMGHWAMEAEETVSDQDQECAVESPDREEAVEPNESS